MPPTRTSTTAWNVLSPYGGRFECEYELRRLRDNDHLDFERSGSEEEQEDFSGGEGGEAAIDSIFMPPENCITNHRGMVVRQQA